MTTPNSETLSQHDAEPLGEKPIFDIVVPRYSSLTEFVAGKSDPYCKISLANRSNGNAQKSSTQKKTLEPTWYAD